MNYKLKITLCTWSSNQNTLFDYESSNHHSEEIDLCNNGIVYETEYGLSLKKEKGRNDFVVAVKQGIDVYKVNLSETEPIENGEIPNESIPWLVVRNCFPKETKVGYKLKQGDIIKIGKILLRVKEFRLRDQIGVTMIENKQSEIHDNLNDRSNIILNPKGVGHAINKSIDHNSSWENLNQTEKLLLNNNKTNISNTNRRSLLLKKKHSIKAVCKICLGDDYGDTNPLIAPCKCKGTMKFIHLNCLRQLIKSKLTTTNAERVIVLSYKTLHCDLCKALLPEKVKLKDRTVDVMELNRPDCNFIILQTVSRDSPDTECLYIIHLLDKQVLKIGRSSETDLRLNDISVSRSHCLIKNHKGSYYISDNKSKFGTLVQGQNNMIVIPNAPLHIQRGRYYLKLKMIKKLCAKLRCYNPTQLLFKDYNEFFLLFDERKRFGTEDECFIKKDTALVSEYSSNEIEEDKANEGKLTSFDIKKESMKDSNLKNTNIDDMSMIHVTKIDPTHLSHQSNDVKIINNQEPFREKEIIEESSKNLNENIFHKRRNSFDSKIKLSKEILGAIKGIK